MESISRIAVPFFFMVSGYYTAEKKREELKPKIRKTAFLLFWSVTLYFVWELLWSFYHQNTLDKLQQYFSVRAFTETFVLNTGLWLGHLWFILAQLYCFCIYYLGLLKRSGRHKFVAAVVLFVACFGIREVLRMNGVSDTVYYTRNFLFTGLPFFIAGDLISRNRIKVMSIRAGFWGLLGAVGIVAAITERLVISSSDLYYGTIIAAIAFFILSQQEHIPYDRLLSKIGQKCSTDIYILHVIVIGVFNMVAAKLNLLYNDLFLSIRPFGVLMACIAISWCKVAYLKSYRAKWLKEV